MGREWPVCARKSAFAPGHEYVGGDMMRRRGSCCASAFFMVSVIRRSQNSRGVVRALAWFLNMLVKVKTKVAPVLVPSVQAEGEI